MSESDHSDVSVRQVCADDWQRIVAVMPEWWGGRDLRALLPKIFLEHFCNTSFVAEHDGQLLGFLVGFLCPTHPDEAYVHFIGVHPGWRRSGLGRDLYERFFLIAEVSGRRVVRAVTAPENRASIAFHTSIGFSMASGDGVVGGVPVTLDQDGPGEHRVHFELHLPSADPEGRTSISISANRLAAGGHSSG